MNVFAEYQRVFLKDFLHMVMNTRHHFTLVLTYNVLKSFRLNFHEVIGSVLFENRKRVINIQRFIISQDLFHSFTENIVPLRNSSMRSLEISIVSFFIAM